MIIFSFIFYLSNFILLSNGLVQWFEMKQKNGTRKRYGIVLINCIDCLVSCLKKLNDDDTNHAVDIAVGCGVGVDGESFEWVGSSLAV